MPLPILVILAFGLIAIGVVAHQSEQENKRLRRDADYIAKTYLRKQGATTLYPSNRGECFTYDLRSWDAGKTWYACQIEGAGQNYLKILGEADTIYPGLLLHLKAMDSLTEYISKQGQFNLNEELERKLLEDAGFQIKTH